MNLKIKNTRYLIVLLAVMVISSHELIPHHHHYDSIYSHSFSDKDINHKTSEHHHSGNPENHCHALNDLINNRSAQSQSVQLTAPIHFTSGFTDCCEALIEDKHVQAYKLANHLLPSLIQCSGQLHFRGPPVFI